MGIMRLRPYSTGPFNLLYSIALFVCVRVFFCQRFSKNIGQLSWSCNFLVSLSNNSIRWLLPHLIDSLYPWVLLCATRRCVQWLSCKSADRHSTQRIGRPHLPDRNVCSDTGIPLHTKCDEHNRNGGFCTLLCWPWIHHRLVNGSSNASFEHKWFFKNEFLLLSSPLYYLRDQNETVWFSNLNHLKRPVFLRLHPRHVCGFDFDVNCVDAWYVLKSFWPKLLNVVCWDFAYSEWVRIICIAMLAFWFSNPSADLIFYTKYVFVYRNCSPGRMVHWHNVGCHRSLPRHRALWLSDY